MARTLKKNIQTEDNSIEVKRVRTVYVDNIAYNVSLVRQEGRKYFIDTHKHLGKEQASAVYDTIVKEGGEVSAPVSEVVNPNIETNVGEEKEVKEVKDGKESKEGKKE